MITAKETVVGMKKDEKSFQNASITMIGYKLMELEEATSGRGRRKEIIRIIVHQVKRAAG